jgi:hypothetical protein
LSTALLDDTWFKSDILDGYDALTRLLGECEALTVSSS